VSSAAAPLRAILFLEQSADNEIVPLSDRRLVLQRLLATLIRPMVTADWWHKEMDVLEQLVDEVPCFTMRFDKSGKGEGRMAYATQISFDKKKNAIELENYSSEPVRLNELKLEIKK
jgi:hypothetical protein